MRGLLSISRRGAARRAILAILAIVVVVVAAYFGLRSEPEGMVDLETAERCIVERGDLVITLLQTGELAAKNSKSITNDTLTTCKIIDVVEDGARVEKGDLLVELDVAELRDKLMTAEANVSQAEASLEEAEEDLEIRELQHRTDLRSAQLKVELARLELEKFKEAAHPLDVKEAQSALTLAREELARAIDKRDSIKRLVERGFTNPQELESAELEVTRRRLDVDTKQTKLAILQDYTYTKELKQKENDLIRAEAEVDRLVKTHKANMTSRRVKVESNRTSLEVARNRLERIREQVAAGRIYSEYDGFVFYPQQPRWRQDRNIEKGATVHPRQQILEFPDLSAWVIKTGVPESIIKRVEQGMKAYATIDALPGVVLECAVESISVVPDNKRWYEADTKQYTVTLDVLALPGKQLKPGMSVMVEIITDELKDVVKAPIQAVATREGKHYVYVIDGRRYEAVEVQVGKHNETHIEILDGVEPGSELLLYAPVEKETAPLTRGRPTDKAEAAGEKSREGGDQEAPAEPQAERKPERGEKRPASSGGERRRQPRGDR